MEKVYVIGLDYGTDSVRAILVDARSGEELAYSSFDYPRWAAGLYCNEAENRFRQHPLDMLEGLEHVIRDVVDQVPDARDHVKAINVDCTGCTPCLCDRNLTPLSLLPEYSEDPAAMFFLWKDHSSQEESDRIERMCEGRYPALLSHSGGHHSPESYWSKVARALKENPSLEAVAEGAIEMHDYLPAVLCGIRRMSDLKESRATIAAKHLWAPELGGFPDEEFIRGISPALLKIYRNRNLVNYTPDTVQGALCPEWASRLGLGEDVKVGVGHLDSWSGAVGAGVGEGRLIMSIGTSAAYTAVMPTGAVSQPIDGVLCQVEDLAVPGMTGFETGLSAFGDAYAWLKKVLCWAAPDAENVLARLNEEAAVLDPKEDSPLATDWFNGRRTPSTDMSATASFINLRLSTTPAELFYAIVESTAFATRAVIDLLVDNGVRVDSLIAIGGIAQKSPFVMQMLSDVLQRPIELSSCVQSCAYGAVLFASVNAGIYPDVQSAQKALCKPSSTVYHPRPEKAALLEKRYSQYLALGAFTSGRR